MQSLKGYTSQEAWSADQEALFVFEENTRHYIGSMWEPFGDVADYLKSLYNVLPDSVVTQSYEEITSLKPPHMCTLKFPQCTSLTYPGHQGDMIVLIRIEAEGNRFASMFPYKRLSRTFEGSIERVSVWESGVEGEVSISAHGFSLTFFNTHFMTDKNFFVSSGQYGFGLLGVAYRVGYPAQNELTVMMKKEILRAIDEEVKADAEKTFSLKGMKTFLNIDQVERFDYSFRGTILSIRQEVMLDQQVFVVMIDALCDLDEKIFELPLIITPLAWQESEPPKVGDEIDGNLWLQGRLVHVF